MAPLARWHGPRAATWPLAAGAAGWVAGGSGPEGGLGAGKRQGRSGGLRTVLQLPVPGDAGPLCGPRRAGLSGQVPGPCRAPPPSGSPPRPAWQLGGPKASGRLRSAAPVSVPEARRVWSLTENLIKLLWDTDEDTLAMTLSVLSFTVSDKGTLIASSTALQMAEALLPLFDNEHSHVQLLSMILFQEIMNYFVEEGKKAFKVAVRQSLLPLFFHCHDENQEVADVSGSTLLRATEFLKRKDLEKLVKKKELWKFTECLLAEDLSRRVQHLHQAVPYLDSPQEPLREAAIRFIGMAGRRLRRQSEQFRFVCLALEHMTSDISPAISNLALQTLYIMRALEGAPCSIFLKLRDRLQSAWQTRPRLWGRGWLCCWSFVES